MSTKPSVFRFALIAAFVLVLALVPAALAGRGGNGGGGHGGGGGGGKPGGGSGSASLNLVIRDPDGGGANYGEQVTFDNVSASGTTEPFVRLDCYEGGTWVLSSSAGFFDSYPWPWTRNFTLSWDMWHTPGAQADCTATLYSGSTTYKTLNFHVFA